MRKLAGSGIAGAAALAIAGAACAQSPVPPPPPGATTVGGGGQAEACAAAAERGETGVRAEQVCATALSTLALAPLDRAGTLVNLGVIRLRSGRYDQAAEDFTTAIRYQPQLAEAYVNRGAARIGLHQFKESLADLNKALELGVKEPEKAYYDRALAADWLGDPQAAFLDYKKALELAPAWELPRDQLFRLRMAHADLALPSPAGDRP